MSLAPPALRPLFFTGGIASLILGFIGAFVPVLPTTPFAILSAYLFSKSSPRLHRWLLSLPVLGPGVRDWEQHKVIRPRAKVLALATIFIVFGISLIVAPVGKALKLMLVVIGLSVSTFIVTRKSVP